MPNATELRWRFMGLVARHYPETVTSICDAAATSDTFDAGAWGRQWNLPDDWCLNMARETFSMARNHPKHLPASFISDVVVWGSSRKGLFEYIRWDWLDDMKQSDYNELLVRRFREHLVREAAENMRRQKADGYVDARDHPTATRNLTWLAHWQVGMLNRAQIAAWASHHQREKPGPETIGKQIARYAALIGLSRRPGKPASASQT